MISWYPYTSRSRVPLLILDYHSYHRDMHRVSGQGDVESTFENHRFSKVESFLGITVLPKLCIDCREIANEEGHTSTVRVSVVIPRKLQPPFYRLLLVNPCQYLVFECSRIRCWYLIARLYWYQQQQAIADRMEADSIFPHIHNPSHFSCTAFSSIPPPYRGHMHTGLWMWGNMEFKIL